MVYKKLVVLILIPAIFLSSAYSTYATDWFFAVKEFGVDIAARAIAASLIRSLTGKLIYEIQTGGEGGNPAFVQNWTNFLTTNQYRGEDAFRAILASTTICGYLNSNIRGLFKANDILPMTDEQKRNINIRVNNFDPFTLRANCTLPLGFNMANYQQNFSGNGGWNTWSRLLEPQNNYYGLLLQSHNEAANQRNLYEQASYGEAQAGSGYTSIRRDGCQDQLAGTGDTGPSVPSEARCTFMGKIFTPGDLLGKTAALTIDKDMEGIINSDELSETLIAISSSLIGRMTNLAGSVALSGGSEGGSGDGDIYNQTDEQVYIQNLKEEYCSAAKPSTKAIAVIAQQNPVTFVEFPVNAHLNSFCNQYRDADNPYPYQRCILACFKSLEIIPEDIATAPKPGPDENVNGPDESGGGGGRCAGQAPGQGGAVLNYGNNVLSAIDAVIARNPDGIADASNIDQNRFTFINLVASELQSSGFNAITNVLNGNGNPNTGDLVALWRSGDTTMERYDILRGDYILYPTIGTAAWSEFANDIPLTCVQ